MAKEPKVKHTGMKSLTKNQCSARAKQPSKVSVTPRQYRKET